MGAKLTVQNFWDRVDVKDDEDCWLWVGAAGGEYGNFKNTRPHRYSWELHNGAIPEGMCVCHTCDIFKCVNPNHLFLGTIKDNNQDMWSKGRGWSPFSRGEAHYPGKLTDTDAARARNLFMSGEKSANELAEMFGMDGSNMYRLLYNETYADADYIPPPKRQYKRRRGI